MDGSWPRSYFLCAYRNLDYEEQSSYEFEVVATDMGDYPAPLSGLATVVVHVLDANDEAPHFNASAYSFQIDEGTGPLVIGQVIYFAIQLDLFVQLIFFNIWQHWLIGNMN